MKDQKNFRYIEWKSPEEMHYSAQQWSSSLAFMKDEHLFFEDMLREYTLPIIESNLIAEVKTLIDRLNTSKKEMMNLNEKVSKHKNGLDILVDGINQPEEEKKYKEEHRALLNEVNAFSESFRQLKKDIFANVTGALKKQKQKRLLK
ncbi:hypothetical protein [Salegentibacter sediminis]|uniref:hypothetical protein n=1 Tax=Salegentibacter sediminis TaxID=1930251 RepID=UPI0009BD91C9|nr:hypothetical protein [Salegentibacter sediminis]